MQIEPALAHAALEARDKRFDGVFFTGVSSTGIYCRCVCPARIPKPENRRFFPSAAAAERAGFRPCLVCRPECAPGRAPIDAGERLAQDAMKRIEAGALEEIGLEGLAAELGVTARHLRRATLKAFGAAPVELAQTHRLLAAKRLLAETRLPVTQVAFAAGFRSVRRFNALFQERYGFPPTRARTRNTKQDNEFLTLRLGARGALDADFAVADLRRRAADRHELALGPHRQARTWEMDGRRGWAVLAFDEGGITLSLSEGLTPVFRPILAAVRGAFDLDADTHAIDGFLRARGFAGDPVSYALTRLPGSLDAFETAVRAVIGQQVSLKAARTVLSRITAALGAPIETPFAGLDRLFPTPAALARAPLQGFGLTRARADTINRLAGAVVSGELNLARGAVAAGRAGLGRLSGIGPWTVEYVSLRGLGDPDAFPLGDAGLRAGFGGGDLAEASKAWRPWRAYAAARLWRRHGEREQAK